MPSSYYSKIKKFAKKATKAAGKRYEMSYGRRGLRMSKHSMPKIVKDIEMIKDRLNVEKKQKVGLVQTGTVSQFDGNSPGFIVHDLTPLWTQGVGEEQRVGNSIKLTGYNMKIQLRGMTQCINARRLKLQLVKTTRNATVPLANIIEDMYDINPLTSIVDYHSNKDYSDNQKTEKILRTQYMYLKDVAIFQNTPSSPCIKDYSISLKLDDVLRFENNLTTAPNDVRYFVVILVDTGNKSTSTTTTNPGCMVPGQYTGVEYQFHDKFWYVDN